MNQTPSTVWRFPIRRLFGHVGVSKRTNIAKSSRVITAMTTTGLLCAAMLSGVSLQAAEQQKAAKRVSYNRDIRPILAEHCFACHGPDRNSRKADLRLDQRETAVDATAIVPNHPGESQLILRIESNDPQQVMPPPETKKPLTDAQRTLLRQWIAEGAEYEPHWAFLSVPLSVAVPTVKPGNGSPTAASSAPRNSIDSFVLAQLQAIGMTPAVEASREAWIRRVSFDLTGLPPTVAELDAFLADNSAQAHETVVDRLLKSPAFGERMAMEWLDVARYADTFGYQSDRLMHVWPWRDWCIRAFNENLPYDQFILWQTAGDLLPNATRDQRLATAFNRLHRQTNEGGSIEAEFRAAYVADRVATNGTAFLGLTLDCARCHDHKFDPISQKEYYQLAAFFGNIDEHGLYSHFTETAPTPTLLLYESDQEAQHRELLIEIAKRESELAMERTAAKARYSEYKSQKLEASLNELAAPPPAATFSFEDLQPAGDYRPGPGKQGQGITFGGDDAYTCKGAGAFGRVSPFTFSVWLKPSQPQPREVVLHRCVAAEDASYRGYSLILDNGQPVFSLIHFWPGNAIRVRVAKPIPTTEWTHLTVTYDGSSHAAGVRLYVNGQPAEQSIERDTLTRDIVYRGDWGDSGSPELSLGARFRDVGFLQGSLDELLVFDKALTPLEVAKLLEQPLPESDALRFEHYLARVDETYRKKFEELQELRRRENELVAKVRQVMAMKELEARRPTHILTRGAYDAPGEEVQPGIPSCFPPLDPSWPANRLGLARWMIDERNPLVSRVAVNRFWQLFFGRGLVSTPSDFGTQGQVPTHPELLDWLARHFINSGWDVKGLCKLMVLSATYRQSSVPENPNYYRDDPDNAWLARGPRHRLSAEQIRDNALAVSGRITLKLGGPSVFPYQPAGLWEESGTGHHYPQSHGDDLYRRSLYTFWRRTSPPPSMISFDATSREVCTAKRERTATPLQALVLLNDPQFVEASRLLAERILREHKDDAGAGIVLAFRILTSRAPRPPELEIIQRLHDDQLKHFQASPEQALAFLAIGENPRDEKLDTARLAAMAVVTKTLMSFDECVTKR